VGILPPVGRATPIESENNKRKTASDEGAANRITRVQDLAPRFVHSKWTGRRVVRQEEAEAPEGA